MIKTSKLKSDLTDSWKPMKIVESNKPETREIGWQTLIVAIVAIVLGYFIFDRGG